MDPSVKESHGESSFVTSCHASVQVLTRCGRVCPGPAWPSKVSHALIFQHFTCHTTTSAIHTSSTLLFSGHKCSNRSVFQCSVTDDYTQAQCLSQNLGWEVRKSDLILNLRVSRSRPICYAAITLVARRRPHQFGRNLMRHQ